MHILEKVSRTPGLIKKKTKPTTQHSLSLSALIPILISYRHSAFDNQLSKMWTSLICPCLSCFLCPRGSYLLFLEEGRDIAF